MKDQLKSIGAFVTSLVIFLGAIFVVAFFIKGGVWLGAMTLVWLFRVGNVRKITCGGGYILNFKVTLISLNEEI